MTRVKIGLGEAILHMGDLVHAAAPETEGLARKRLVAMITAKRKGLESDDVFLAKDQTTYFTAAPLAFPDAEGPVDMDQLIFTQGGRPVLKSGETISAPRRT